MYVVVMQHPIVGSLSAIAFVFKCLRTVGVLFLRTPVLF